MFSVLTSRAWWAAAGQRAARSALVVMVTYVIGAGGLSHINATLALSAGALMAVLSLVTSLAGLPELDGTQVPWWVAVLVRGLKSFFQALGALWLPSWVVLTDVPWATVLDGAAATALGTILLALISHLPETQALTIPASAVVQVVHPDGTIVAGPASPLPDGTPIAQPTTAP